MAAVIGLTGDLPQAPYDAPPVKSNTPTNSHAYNLGINAALLRRIKGADGDQQGSLEVGGSGGGGSGRMAGGSGSGDGGSGGGGGGGAGGGGGSGGRTSPSGGSGSPGNPFFPSSGPVFQSLKSPSPIQTSFVSSPLGEKTPVFDPPPSRGPDPSGSTAPMSPVPLPSSLPLLGLALLGLAGGAAWRKRRAKIRG